MMNVPTLTAAVALFLAACAAHAFPIAAPGTEGLSVVVISADHVFATYQGNSASYSNDLRLNGTFVFNNHATPVGTTVDLGSFAVGTELIFEMFVNNTGYSYFTGPASRNPDGGMHARVQSDWEPGTALVSFEDLYNGSFDYNDLSVSLTNTVGVVPEPSIFALLALSGLCLVGVTVRTRKSRSLG